MSHLNPGLDPQTNSPINYNGVQQITVEFDPKSNKYWNSHLVTKICKKLKTPLTVHRPIMYYNKNSGIVVERQNIFCDTALLTIHM